MAFSRFLFLSSTWKVEQLIIECLMTNPTNFDSFCGSKKIHFFFLSKFVILLRRVEFELAQWITRLFSWKLFFDLAFGLSLKSVWASDVDAVVTAVYGCSKSSTRTVPEGQSFSYVCKLEVWVPRGVETSGPFYRQHHWYSVFHHIKELSQCNFAWYYRMMVVINTAPSVQNLKYLADVLKAIISCYSID